MPLAHHESRALHLKRFGAHPVVEAREVPTPSPSTYVEKTVANGNSSARIGSIVAGVLSAIVLVGAFLLWRYRVWNKQKAKRNAALENKVSTEKNSYTYFGQEKIDLTSSVYVEKPRAVYSSQPSSPESFVGWTPQITAYRGVQMTPKQLESLKSSPKKYAKWEKALQLNRQQSPPSYTTSPTNIALPPSPPESPPYMPPTPPTPPATTKSRSRALTPPSESLPKPTRSSSFRTQLHRSGSLSKEKPKLMKVVNTFTPNLEDELTISIGETIRLVEEYPDGWCMIQRKDSRTGVIPRFCLVDRPPSSESRTHVRSGSMVSQRSNSF
jgi:hypothetical protein